MQDQITLDKKNIQLFQILNTISYLINITLLISFNINKALYMVNSKCRNYLKFGPQGLQVSKLLHQAES